MSEPQGASQVKKYTNKAVGTLQGAQGALLLDPNFLLGRDLGYELANDPLSWNPQAIEGAKSNVTSNAYGHFGGQMDQINEAATAGQGFRSGTTNAQKRHAAMDLGDSISQGHRQIDTQAALQRPADIINAMNAQMPYLQLPMQMPMAIANAYQGAASNPVWGQPSPLQQIGQGAGGLIGTGLAPGGFLGLGGK